MLVHILIFILNVLTFPVHQLKESVILRICASDLMRKNAADFSGIHVGSHRKCSGI